MKLIDGIHAYSLALLDGMTLRERVTYAAILMLPLSLVMCSCSVAGQMTKTPDGTRHVNMSLALMAKQAAQGMSGPAGEMTGIVADSTDVPVAGIAAYTAASLANSAFKTKVSDNKAATSQAKIKSGEAVKLQQIKSDEAVKTFIPQ